jgi:hypothetical protein
MAVHGIRTDPRRARLNGITIPVSDFTFNGPAQTEEAESS